MMNYQSFPVKIVCRDKNQMFAIITDTSIITPIIFEAVLYYLEHDLTDEMCIALFVNPDNVVYSKITFQKSDICNMLDKILKYYESIEKFEICSTVLALKKSLLDSGLEY